MQLFFICDEIKKYVLEKASQYECKEEVRPTRTRREERIDKNHFLASLESYVLFMWEGFSKKLEIYDKDGTIIWSEAQAEGIFLILGFIIENKHGLSVQYMI